jgi:hypothetical protein
MIRILAAAVLVALASLVLLSIAPVSQPVLTPSFHEQLGLAHLDALPVTPIEDRTFVFTATQPQSAEPASPR